jgi:hypothetical protein
MQFLFPLFLGAAALIAIPIIIHLFYFRRFKKVYFTNVRFLKELKEETSSRSRLRNLLVLLMRILAFLFLVLAFAQPFFGSKDEDNLRPRSVGIFVDNSFSMQALSQDVPVFERARQRALQILEAFEETDRFQIITHDFMPRHMRLVDKNTAREFIEELEISPSVRPLSAVIERMQKTLFENKENRPIAYILSDFQQNISDLPDSAEIEINLIPLKAVQERNISIDSAWFESPVQLESQVSRLIVKITNYDSNPVENARLSFEYAGEKKPTGQINIPGNASVTDTISLTIKGNGWQDMLLEITDYPIQFDDKYYLAFEVPAQLPVLYLYENVQNPWIDAAFSANPVYVLKKQPVNQVDYSSFASNRLIILSDPTALSSGLIQELTQYVNQGGNLLIFPANLGKSTMTNPLFTSLGVPGLGVYQQGTFEGFQLNIRSFIYKDVFERTPENLKLPVASARYQLRLQNGEQLLGFRDGQPFLVNYPSGKGFVFVSAVPLDKNTGNLQNSAEIFIPLMFRAPLLKAEASAISYTIGKDEQVELQLPQLRGDISYRVKGPVEFIPSVSNLGSRAVLRVFNQIVLDGIYKVYLGENQLVASMAFNYDRTESDPRSFSIQELKDKYPSYKILDVPGRVELASIISREEKGVSLWRICLILAIMCILAEIFILRFWKA